jgi:NitT/TauT family transport system substrate-binding protein
MYSRRRALASVSALVTAAVGGDLLRAQGRPEKTRVLIGVSGKASFSQLPLTIAEQLGYFKLEGLDVDIADWADGAQPPQPATGGMVQVVSAGYEQTIHVQSRSQALQAFVLQARAPAFALGVSAKTFPGFASATDLRGKKIGLSVPGSLASMVAGTTLLRAGLQTSDVSFVNLGGGSAARVRSTLCAQWIR